MCNGEVDRLIYLHHHFYKSAEKDCFSFRTGKAASWLLLLLVENWLQPAGGASMSWKHSVYVAATQRNRNTDTHLMSCMLPYETLVVWVPEANTPIIGGADTDVTLPSMLTEWKARHQVFMTHKLTWKTQRELDIRATVASAWLNHKKFGTMIWDLNLLDPAKLKTMIIRSTESINQQQFYYFINYFSHILSKNTKHSPVAAPLMRGFDAFLCHMW